MSKLIPRIWDFCAEAASHIYQTGGYRLVITRVGRIGAGETIEWCKIIQQKLKNQKKIEKKERRSSNHFSISDVIGARCYDTSDTRACSKYYEFIS